MRKLFPLTEENLGLLDDKLAEKVRKLFLELPGSCTKMMPRSITVRTTLRPLPFFAVVTFFFLWKRMSRSDICVLSLMPWR